VCRAYGADSAVARHHPELESGEWETSLCDPLNPGAEHAGALWMRNRTSNITLDYILTKDYEPIPVVPPFKVSTALLS